MLTKARGISFPLGIAKGKYFCNRVAETKQLIRNIHNCTHSVLISPRRYGKTSLAYKAIRESKLPSARIDLYMTTSAADIEKAIIAGVDNLLSHICSNAEMLLSLIKDFIKVLKPSFEMGTRGLKIKLQPSDKTTSSANICEALQILDGILRKKSIKAVLLIDEFQEVQLVAPNQGIEGAIRHVAQETENFTLIFSGSHRHLLSSMFNNKNKPLYRLCDEIQLNRISEADYLPFLKKFSLSQWEETLNEPVMNAILNYSERHPYYFNAICEKLFMKETLPTVPDVDAIWQHLLITKKKDVLTETKELNITHKKLLVAISHGINKELTGQQFLSQAELPGSTVVRALEYLEDNDFIEKRNDQYYIIDPLLKGIINQLTYF